LSLRENLDPEGLHTDEEIWDALEKSHVRDHPSQMIRADQAVEGARRDTGWQAG